jgi:antitoxin VapB
MPFSVKNDRADVALRDLMEVTGEGITEAVTRALEDRLARARVDAAVRSVDMRWHVAEFQTTWAHLRETAHISDDEIIGYDRDGLPV